MEIPSRSNDRVRIDSAIHKMLKARKHKVSDSLLYELKEEGRKWADLYLIIQSSIWWLLA